jgi:hypothetical protein
MSWLAQKPGDCPLEQLGSFRVNEVDVSIKIDAIDRFAR